MCYRVLVKIAADKFAFKDSVLLAFAAHPPLGGGRPAARAPKTCLAVFGAAPLFISLMSWNVYVYLCVYICVCICIRVYVYIDVYVIPNVCRQPYAML